MSPARKSCNGVQSTEDYRNEALGEHVVSNPAVHFVMNRHWLGEWPPICLDMGGHNRPPAFRTTPGSHCALEILRRASAARPDSVTGGTPQPPPERLAPETIAVEFAYVDSSTLARLQGQWTSVRLVQDGNEIPSGMATTGERVAIKNEIKVTFGGQMMLHALVRIHESTDPIEVDYCLLAGPVKGVLQFGIMKWVGDEVCFCMAPPRNPRPTDFSCARRPSTSSESNSQVPSRARSCSTWRASWGQFEKPVFRAMADWASARRKRALRTCARVILAAAGRCLRKVPMASLSPASSAARRALAC